MTAALDVDIDVRRGAFALDARFTAAAGEVVAVLGPNGSGKSTLLRSVAGLEPASGEVAVDGRSLTGSAPQHRPVAWVPQGVALFPHLTVVDNVAFGIGGRRARTAAHEWLERLGIGELAERRPSQLSGGQAQKVALARALARRPRVLLLDEPLAALDANAKADVRRTLRAHLSDFDGVALLVTHDVVDAATLATRIVAIEGGRVVQDGPLSDVTRRPRSPWLAEMLGANAARGRVSGGGIDLDAGGRLVAVDLPSGVDAPVLAVFAPHAVTLHREEPHGSARNTWGVVVRHLAAVGGRVRVDADGAPPVVAEVTAAAVQDLGLVEGSRVWASVKATEVTVVEL